jgi:hypothetical protein
MFQRRSDSSVRLAGKDALQAKKQPGISAALGNRLPRQRNHSPHCLLERQVLFYPSSAHKTKQEGAFFTGGEIIRRFSLLSANGRVVVPQALRRL